MIQNYAVIGTTASSSPQTGSFAFIPRQGWELKSMIVNNRGPSATNVTTLVIRTDGSGGSLVGSSTGSLTPRTQLALLKGRHYMPDGNLPLCVSTLPSVTSSRINLDHGQLVFRLFYLRAAALFRHVSVPQAGTETGCQR